MPLNEENEMEEEDKEEKEKKNRFDEDFQKYQIELKQAASKFKQSRRKLNRIVSDDNFTTSIGGRSQSESKHYKNNKFYRD